MTPTTAQRPVLKIHMASDARPATLLGGVPSKRESASCWWHISAIDTWLKDLSLTAGGGEGFIEECVLHAARYAQPFGNVDLQVAGDVVQVGVWEQCRHRSHWAFGGLGGVVDEPVDPGFRKATRGVAVEAGVVSPVGCLLPPHQRPAEAGCKQPQVNSFNGWIQRHTSSPGSRSDSFTAALGVFLHSYSKMDWILFIFPLKIPTHDASQWQKTLTKHIFPSILTSLSYTSQRISMVTAGINTDEFNFGSHQTRWWVSHGLRVHKGPFGKLQCAVY